jgi:Holliday junction resolvase
MSCNKTVGNRFERELCSLLSGAGWWAHNLAQNQAGQPADVIAVRKNIAVLIDCKVCSHDRFPLSRMEDNQVGAMTLWESAGNAHGYFALKMSKGVIFMADFDTLSRYCLSKTLNREEIQAFPTLEEWLEVMNHDG